MDANMLLLADSRLPAGGHAHSGGLEQAAAAGTVADLDGLADFLRGRLATVGLVCAALAAAACRHASVDTPADAPGPDGRDGWALLDAEADARTPSPAQRRASRAQGRALLRVARTAWPHPALDALDALGSLDVVSGRPGSRGPHHPVALGAATAAAGGTAEQAATIAAYGTVTGPAAAAVRLLGLDPLAVHRVLAGLAPDVSDVGAAAVRAAVHAATTAITADDGWAGLPALSAPVLDLYAELHLQSQLRLFES
ncbi:MAG TPA: urease accessory UreF family protein [Streptosporangiaceae bacterium]|nr:urease accessory UreF family protein [Streptosporangiaceae bacterium]